MKRKLSLLCTAVLCAGLLSACGQEAAGTTATPTTAALETSAAAETTAPETNAPAATAAQAPAADAPKVQALPPLAEASYELDLKNQAKQYYYGLYEQEVKMEDESVRTMKVYCPDGTRRDCAVIYVAVPDGVDTASFLAQSGWMKVAEENQQIVVLFEPEAQAWAAAETETSYIDAAFSAFSQNLYFYSYGQDCRFVGYGTGGEMLQRYIMTHPINAAAFVAVDASENLDSAFLTATGATKYEKYEDYEITYGETPVPVWLISSSVTDQTKAVADYWKKANDCLLDQTVLEDGTKVYHQDPYSNSPFTYNQKVGEVRVTEKSVTYTDPEFAAEVYGEFLSRFARTGSGSPYSNVLKAAADESRFVYTTKEVDGITREWYTYVPTTYSESGDPMPVVIYLHGGGQSGRMGMFWSDWWKVGEEKGFIVVCPSAALQPGKDGKIPNMSWNGGQTEGLADDVAFIRTLVEETKTVYHADAGRFYVSGQSNGGQISCVVALTLPDLFAAHANTGATAIKADDALPARLNDGIEIPTFLMLGEYDIDSHDLDDMEKATGHQIRYFVDRYGIKMDDSGSYVNGTYTNRIWQKDGVPMVRFTVVEGRAHSWRPEETAVFWNEWFSQFSRGEDGSLIYQGE